MEHDRTPALDPAEITRLIRGEHAEPHAILGAHAARSGDAEGVLVRAFHPDAAAMELRTGSALLPMAPVAPGVPVFEAFVPAEKLPIAYAIRMRFPSGAVVERDDPYRFLPTVGDVDLHLFGEGTHRRLWERLGAHPGMVEGVAGCAFAVWAPNARRVSVVGDFCRWDGRVFPMRKLSGIGVFEIFIPGLSPGSLYKYEILTQDRMLRLKTDPFATEMELPPGTASRIPHSSRHAWTDDAWMKKRRKTDASRQPMHVYEVHLGSWRRVASEGNRSFSYREIAPLLVEHVKSYGFTHLELMPIMEHPFDGSWGYQVSGYYAPTARFGSPDDLRFLVDTAHHAGIGVILDWVPAHFPRDDFALRRFDGTALYEHGDPRLGEHPDWGTLIFDYGRPEVRAFLVANALYWLEVMHADGLRVDAVASMLYLDYSRQEGQWIPNRYGGRENLDALALLRDLNEAVREVAPGAIMIAEESTTWPDVTKPVAENGLGFTFKWNMGWMHDTLQYFSLDPLFRSHPHNHNRLTFAIWYEYSERFLMPLSHDEVVHGKRSLLEKMPGELPEKLANLRLLLAYQMTRPGKSMLFMGTELAPHREWDHEASLDWSLLGAPGRPGLQAFMKDLARVYHDHPCFWRSDPDPAGFAWIDCSDVRASVFAYARFDRRQHAVVVFNMTPVVRAPYRVGVPGHGSYEIALDSDASRYGGAGTLSPARIPSEPVAHHGRPRSIELTLPALSVLVLRPARRARAKR
ncbi:MAG: 1,4-alpha-glucan branching protein GlgB [Acidobacteriota bacterium]